MILTVLHGKISDMAHCQHHCLEWGKGESKLLCVTGTILCQNTYWKISLFTYLPLILLTSLPKHFGRK